MKSDKRFLTIFMTQEERNLITKLQEKYRKTSAGDVSPGFIMRSALSYFAKLDGIENDFAQRLWAETFPDPLQEILDKANSHSKEDNENDE